MDRNLYWTDICHHDNKYLPMCLEVKINLGPKENEDIVVIYLVNQILCHWCINCLPSSVKCLFQWPENGREQS